MTRLAIAYGATALMFLILDGGWLAIAGPRLYRPGTGAPAGGEGSAGRRAIVFYLMYVAGLLYFAVLPGADAGKRRARPRSPARSSACSPMEPTT